MKKISKALIIMLIIGLFFIEFFVLFAHAQSKGISETVKTIQQIIMEKGVNWVAGETTISRLPREERQTR